MKVYANVFKTSLGWPRSKSLGWAAVVFNKKGEVLKVVLPTERRKAADQINGLERRPLPRFESFVRRYFDGKPVSLDDIAVNLNGSTPFEKRVYEALRRVSYGSGISYSRLAEKAGSSKAARAVGRAMSKNRVPLLIPCHRVIKADGSPGNFSADGGAALKIKMLALEGAAKR